MSFYKNTKTGKITVRFTEEELNELKKLAKKHNTKLATLIRKSALEAIGRKEFIDDKEELKQMITEIVEQNNDKKLGRIISLIFRATSHTDIVKEQLNILFEHLRLPEKIIEDTHYRRHYKHLYTRIAEEKIKARDIRNINRKKGSATDYMVD